MEPSSSEKKFQIQMEKPTSSILKHGNRDVFGMIGSAAGAAKMALTSLHADMEVSVPFFPQ